MTRGIRGSSPLFIPLPLQCVLLCHALPVRDARLPSDSGQTRAGPCRPWALPIRSGPSGLLTTAQRFCPSRKDAWLGNIGLAWHCGAVGTPLPTDRGRNPARFYVSWRSSLKCAGLLLSAMSLRGPNGPVAIRVPRPLPRRGRLIAAPTEGNENPVGFNGPFPILAVWHPGGFGTRPYGPKRNPARSNRSVQTCHPGTRAACGRPPIPHSSFLIPNFPLLPQL